MQNRPVRIILFILIFSPATLLAQKKLNSPYSRFNLGEINQAGPLRGLSMGGTGIASRDNNSIYFQNPASYTSIDTNTFVFDFGVDMGKMALIDKAETFHSSDLNFNHLLMGFPISKKLKFATGIYPMTNGYYFLSDVVKEGDADYDPNIGQLSYVHHGQGSMADLFAGLGYKVSKNFSVGSNMNLIFGSLSRNSSFDFSDYTNTYDQASQVVYKITGFRFDYGLQYTGKINKKYFINAGLSFSPGLKLKTNYTELFTRFNTYTSASTDTLVNIASTSMDSTKIPASYKAGISFGRINKFVVEADYTYTPWSKGRAPGSAGLLANVSSFNFGIEFTPDKYSNSSFLKRIDYRLGAHYSDNYFTMNGVQLKDYGISAGLGILMRPSNSYSRANIYFDFTRREGDPSRGLINENIFTIGLSLNLFDFWFIKKKYF
ncbi:MAG TPA: hypothetical protein VMT63_12270 [Bacteroidales bacterium]|nr:hypothetical protein [Bacteroidales bacterium]